MAVRHPLFETLWHPLCHKDEVAEAGQYVCLKHLPDDIIVYNDRGNLICFDNVCPHRGAKFVSDYTGKGTLVCPYHAFCYISGGLRTGRCEPITEIQPDVNHYAIASIGNFLFFSPDPKIALTEQFDDAMQAEISKIGAKTSMLFDLNENIFECAAELAVENALEAVHVDSVHPDSLAKLKLSHGSFEQMGLSSSWTSDIQDKRTLRAFKAMSKLLGNEVSETYKNLLLFPYSMISSSGGISYSLQNFFPVSDEHTTFVSRLYPDKNCLGKMNVSQSFLDSSAEVNKQVFAEDAQICSRVTKSQSKKFGKFLVRGEERIGWYRKACAQHA